MSNPVQFEQSDIKVMVTFSDKTVFELNAADYIKLGGMKGLCKREKRFEKDVTDIDYVKEQVLK